MASRMGGWSSTTAIRMTSVERSDEVEAEGERSDGIFGGGNGETGQRGIAANEIGERAGPRERLGENERAQAIILAPVIS